MRKKRTLILCLLAFFLMGSSSYKSFGNNNSLGIINAVDKKTYKSTNEDATTTIEENKTFDTTNDVVDYSQVTQDKLLMEALDCMTGTTGNFSKKAILGNNLSRKPIKVLFKNLSKISPAYTSFDALGWKDNDGQLLIYVNEKHRNAPPEAIACLLCHEALHQDEYSSINEETYCWGLEACEWIELTNKQPKLKKIDDNIYPLVRRMNLLEKMYEDSNYTTKEIRKSVSTNPGYKDLPEKSPGFGE